MVIDENNLKCEFGLAYVRAVAHAAGYFVQSSDRMKDADGVDITLFNRTAGRLKTMGKSIDIQLKTTAHKDDGDQETFPFVLDVKNYNELVLTGYQIPRILVVVIVPEDRANWVEINQDHLLMRHCGYWKSLRGLASSTNKSSVTVEIAQSDEFNITNLVSIMDRINAGGLP